MLKNIGIFLTIAFEVLVIKRFIWWFELFNVMLFRRYWIDVIVCIVAVLILLILGAYNTGRLLEDIKKKLR